MVLKLRSRAADLADTALGQPCAEVAVGEPPSHRGHLAYGSYDRPAQVARIEPDEEDRSRKASGCRHDGALGVGVGPTLSRHRQILLGRDEAVKLDPNRVEASLSLRGHRHGPCGSGVLLGGVDQRDGVVRDVRPAVPCDLLGPGQLLGVVGDQLFQHLGLVGEVGLRGLPWLEEVLATGDDEPTDAGLGIDHKPLEPVGDHEHLFGTPGSLFHPVQVDDRQHQDRKRRGDDDREQAARDDGAPGQPASHLWTVADNAGHDDGAEDARDPGRG
jgi:hypothetical protein